MNNYYCSFCDVHFAIEDKEYEFGVNCPICETGVIEIQINISVLEDEVDKKGDG